EAPSLSSASIAPPINRLTIKSFQRLATIATRSPSALSRPWIVLANQPLLFFGQKYFVSGHRSIINRKIEYKFGYMVCQGMCLRGTHTDLSKATSFLNLCELCGTLRLCANPSLNLEDYSPTSQFHL